MNDSWKPEVEQYFKDLDSFIDNFEKNRKCNCDNPECVHYLQALNKTDLVNTANRLFRERLIENTHAFVNIWKGR